MTRDENKDVGIHCVHPNLRAVQGILLITLVVVVLTFANVLDNLDGCGGDVGIGMALIAALFAALPGKGASVIRIFLEGFILEGGFVSAENAVCRL